MSRTIDQKVVEMKFDNKQFEQAVKQSRQSIKLMEKDIELLDGVKALKNLDSAIKGVDFTHMSKSLDRIKDSFGILGTVGRSIINKLTTDAMNKFNQMTNKVSSAIKNVFNQVYTRGLNRANNLESSAFKIQGLLDRDKSLKDENKKLEITKKLSDMISESVTDTAFGLDEASVAASTLASTFGTDDKALEKIRKTLNAISGIAGTTGASYQQIADIFTNASGKGVAMGDEFYRLSIQGISAQEEIAKYVNSNLKYRKQLNKELGKSVKHEITGAEILKLAGKRKISAELFAEAFEGFIATAKEANETVSGVTDNIGAALGRLGALFLRPLVENSGPLVKFLQAVKDGISAVAKELDKLGIPSAIANIINGGLESATKYVNDFVDAFKKGITPINTFFQELQKIAKALELIFHFDKDDPYLDMGWDQIFRTEKDKRFLESIKERNKAIGNSYRSIKKIKKEFNNNFMNSDQKAAAAQEVYLNQMTDGTLKTQDQWKALYTEYYKVQMGYYEMNKKQQKELLKSSDFKNLVNSSALKEWEEDLYAHNRQLEKTAEYQAKIVANDETIFNYNYLRDFLDGIKNLAGSAAEIFKILGESIFGSVGPLNDFYNLITGNPREARKGLNNLAKGFKEATAKFKDFIKNNAGIRVFISNIGKYVRIFAKVIGGIVKILGHLAVALAPLASRIADIIGSIFNTISSDGSASFSIFDVVVNGICKAIDFLASVLETAFNVLEKIFNWLNDIGVIDVLKNIAGAIIVFIKTAFENWPQAWDMLKTGFKGFAEGAKTVCQWIGKKLKPVISYISPYVGEFADKVYDLTNGFIDLKKPLSWLSDLFGTTSDKTEKITTSFSKANGALENVEGSSNKVATAIDKIKSSMGNLLGLESKGAFSFFGWSDKFGEEANSIKDANDAINRMLPDDINSDDKKAKGPFSWIINLASWLKEQFSKISSEDVKNTIITGLKIFIGIAAVIATMNISKSIKNIGSALENLSAGITGFDVKAERRRRLAEVFKNLALIIGVFIAGIVVLSVAIWALGKIPENQLKQGLDAIIKIGGMIIVMIVVLAFISMFLQGKTKIGAGGSNIFKQNRFLGTMSRETNGPATITNGAARELNRIALIMGIFVAGVILIAKQVKKLGEMRPSALERGMNVIQTIAELIIGLVAILLFALIVISKKGTSINGGNLKSFGIVMIGIAAMLFVFVLSVKMIANLMIKMSKEIGNIDPNNFESTMYIIAAIGASLLIIVAVILLLCEGLLRTSSGLAPEKNKAIIGILGVVAAIIFVIGQAIGSIMRNMVAIIAISKIGDVYGAAALFAEVAAMLVLLVISIMGGVVILAAISSKETIGDKVLSKLSVMLGLIAAIIFVVGQAIGSILRNIVGLVVALKFVKPAVLDATIDILGKVIGGLISFIAVILLSIGIISAIPTTNTGKLIAGLAMVSVIAALFGGIIVALAYSAKLCKSVKIETLMAFISIVAVAGLLLAALIGITAFFATRPTFDESAVYSMTAFVGSLGFLFLAIGVCIALISAKELSDNGVTAFILAVSIVAVLVILAGVVASFSSGTGGPLKAITAFVIGLGVLFALIGLMVYLIGSGVDRFANGIKKLIDTLNSLGEEKNTKNFEKGAKKLGKVFSTFLEAIVDGIIEFGNKIDKKKKDLVGAIEKIGGAIREACSSVFTQIIGFITDRLGDIITAIYNFLTENEEKIKGIIIALENILVPAIANFIGLLLDYVPGLIDKIFDIMDKKTPEWTKRFAKWIADFIDSLVVSLNDNLDTLINAIHNLLKTIVNAIFMFFGMDKIFTDIDTQASKEKKSITEMGAETSAAFGTGLENSDIGWVGNFVTKIGEALYRLVKESPLIKNAANAISDVMWKLSGLEARYNEIMGNLDKKLKADRGLAGDIEDINKKWARAAGLSLDEWAKTGSAEKYWKSSQGKYKLAELLYKNNITNIEDAKRALGKNFNMIGELYFKEAMKYMKSNDFKSGMNKGADFIVNAEINSLNNASDSHSPSKVIANGPGKNMGDGLIVGVVNSIVAGAKTIAPTVVSTISASLITAESGVNKSIDNFSNDLKPMSFGDMLKESFSGVGEQMRQTLDDSGLFGDFFSIKPTVDLTNVEDSKSSIQGIFDNMGIGVNVDAASDMFSSLKSGNFSNLDVSSIASGFDSANNGGISDLGSGETTTNINFNQNNFSPESLSSIDIYRQTESLLGSNSTINGIMNAMGVKSSDLNLSFMQN